MYPYCPHKHHYFPFVPYGYRQETRASPLYSTEQGQDHLVCKGFGAWLADIFVQGQRVNILGFADLTTNQILGSSMKESETTGKQVVQLYSNQTIS